MENETILKTLQKKKLQGSFADGDKVYSPCLGECVLIGTNDYCIDLAKDSSSFPPQKIQLRNDGRLFSDGEIMIFPSEKMREWSKFAWEKYTLLEKGRNKRVFFEKWASPDYTTFIGVDFLSSCNEIKVRRRTYKTLSFHSVAKEESESFYKTLFYYLGKKQVPFLSESVPLYKEVTVKLICDVQKKEEYREALETMTRRAILSDMAKSFDLTEGTLYYFEDAVKKGISYIAKFRKLSDDKKVAFFDWTVVCRENFANCLIDLNMETKRCVGFRRASDEEENKFERVFNDFRNSLTSFVVGQYYTFRVEDNFIYFGKLVSFKEDKSIFTLSDVYCSHRGNKPQYFSEKRFITSHCEDLRIASDSDKYFFDGVKEAYNENRKKNFSFKPKDWCLMRGDDDEFWELCRFAYDTGEAINGHSFVAVGGFHFTQCIPYEGNEQLLGTSKSPDDGKR